MTDIQAILAERGRRYGAFTDQASIEESLIKAMRATEGWENLAIDQRSALSMIAVKIVRVLNGDAGYIDNWDDIAGYAVLVANCLRQ